MTIIMRNYYFNEYFQMEQCLYCIDKLALYTDIAIGDNYKVLTHRY